MYHILVMGILRVTNGIRRLEIFYHWQAFVISRDILVRAPTLTTFYIDAERLTLKVPIAVFSYHHIY